jgi:bifunctional non-homologous end joining protein LigD
MALLKEYARKRNFEETAEPPAERERKSGHRFVVQKHAASRLHYDFRLEMGGVLKSWAVPTGIPFAKGEKHLAVQVEDHPVSYINFEGTIPKGQYGGGSVMVWDKGIFSTDENSPLHELDAGKLHFTLEGKKLHGDWHLVRLRNGTEWLLMKGGDRMKAVSRKSDDTSALSGKSMRHLSESGAVWNSRPGEQQNPVRSKTGNRHRKTGSSPVVFVEPMKACVIDKPPASGDWIYEIKFDGYRAIALKNGADVRLFSRNENDFSSKFPAVVDAIASLGAEDAVIDGEIVALDAKGVSSFQLLQALEIGARPPPIFYYAFDLLQLNGGDLRRNPLVERKAQLQQLLKNAPAPVRFSASFGDSAGKLLKQAKRLGLEGLIGKRADSLYESGKRNGAWIKLKLQREQEFVIGGYTNPEGLRVNFGALLVGFYENKKLKFCGKVGTGFDARLLGSLHSKLKTISREACPFVNLPELRGNHCSPRITVAEMKKCRWVRPEMVCQIRFSEWTCDEKLRQPVFLGLREDKDARDVVHEQTE